MTFSDKAPFCPAGACLPSGDIGKATERLPLCGAPFGTLTALPDAPAIPTIPHCCRPGVPTVISP